MSFTHCPNCGLPWVGHGTACMSGTGANVPTMPADHTAEWLAENVKLRAENADLRALLGESLEIGDQCSRGWLGKFHARVTAALEKEQP